MAQRSHEAPTNLARSRWTTTLWLSGRTRRSERGHTPDDGLGDRVDGDARDQSADHGAGVGEARRDPGSGRSELPEQ